MVTKASDLLKTYMSVTQHIAQSFREHFEQYNLTFPQAMVLTLLGSSGAMPISKLAELTGNANSTISGVIDRLEKLGLAKRIRSDADRRVIYVDVTDSYRENAFATVESVDEYFGSLLEGLTNAQKKQIREALELLDMTVMSKKQTKN